MAITQEQIEQAVSLAKDYGATRLLLFGRTLDHPEDARDLDLACEGVDGWQLYELGARLEELLRTPVDLVPLTPTTRFSKHIESTGKDLL